MSERRRDPLTGETVILASHRSKRPQAPEADDASPEECPFCPGQEDQTPEATLTLGRDGTSSWFVRVFANRYPIVSQEAAPDEVPAGRRAKGIHEVVVETPLHEQEMAQRTAEELKLTLVAYQARLRELLGRRGIRYVAVFKNKGPEAGNSLAHPHSQIAALSYVPGAVRSQAAKWHRYHRRTGRCLLCTELRRELEQGRRVILDRDGFVLFAPYGSTRPGEMSLAPVRHQRSFLDATDRELAAMSAVLLSGLRRLHEQLDDPAYNLVLQTWPEPSDRDDAALHWYLRVLPRLGVLGGFELATGDFVSTMPPERAAELYRESESG